MTDCSKCEKGGVYNATVPFIVHENLRAQMSAINARLIRVIVLLIVLLVCSNVAWLYYESQFETETTHMEIELGMGGGFNDLFKTITCDNGTEFSDAAGIERSVYGGSRTKTYFCHPYSSYERGSNENANKLIRRWQPKGSNFDDITEAQVQFIEDWMNMYPRKLHKWSTSEDEFQKHFHSCMNDL